MRALKVGDNEFSYYPVDEVEGAGSLPYSLTVLLENVLRNARSDDEAATYAKRIVDAGLAGKAGEEVEFAPARVLFQDFTGVPVFVDFAVMRDACVELGGDLDAAFDWIAAHRGKYAAFATAGARDPGLPHLAERIASL